MASSNPPSLGSNSPGNGPRRLSSGSRFSRSPSRDQIDSILEIARQRKIALDISGAPLSLSPTSRSLPRMPSHAMTDAADTHREGGAVVDEETVLDPAGPGQERNYMSILPPSKTASSLTTAGRNGQSKKEPRRGESRSNGSNNGSAAASPPTQHDLEDEHESWWAAQLAKFGSIELENKGSVARDHLALERTFLAWLRTSLAFASIGIAITQLFRLNTASLPESGGDPYKHLRQLGKPLGATFLAISIVMLGVGFHRYFESQHWIIRGKFPASRGSVALVSIITFTLILTSLVVVIVVGPSAYEK